MALQHQQHQHQQQQQQQQRRGIRSRTVDTWLTLAGDFDAKRRVAGIYGGEPFLSMCPNGLLYSFDCN